MKIARLAFTVGFFTLISRIFGYIRDVAIAFFLGASALNDIFIIALRLPNMFRTIFGEGAFSAAFIPIFSSKLKKDGAVAAKEFAQKTQILLIIALIIFTIIMTIFMAPIMSFMAPGYTHDPEMMSLAVTLGRISFPYIIFVSLMAFYGGITNAMGNFKIFASAPIIMNIVLVLFVCLGNTQLDKVYWLTYGLVVSGILEMLWVLYFARKMLGNIKLIKPIMDPQLKPLFKRIVPGIFGSGIAQINILVSTMIASFVASGVSYLYYADRIYQLPLAIIGTALGTVMLPMLSKRTAIEDRSKFKVLQNNAILFSLYLTIPATILILLFATPIIGLLFEYGEFSKESTTNVAFALQIFALGLPMYSLTKICTSAFFAIGDTKTPVKISALSIVANIIISFTFLPLLSYASVALGSVVASYVTVLLLCRKLILMNMFVTYKQALVKSLKLCGVAGSLGFIALIILMASNIESYLYTLLLFGPIYCVLYLGICHFSKIYKIKKLS